MYYYHSHKKRNNSASLNSHFSARSNTSTAFDSGGAILQNRKLHLFRFYFSIFLGNILSGVKGWEIKRWQWGLHIHIQKREINMFDNTHTCFIFLNYTFHLIKQGSIDIDWYRDFKRFCSKVILQYNWSCFMNLEKDIRIICLFQQIHIFLSGVRRESRHPCSSLHLHLESKEVTQQDSIWLIRSVKSSNDKQQYSIFPIWISLVVVSIHLWLHTKSRYVLKKISRLDSHSPLSSASRSLQARKDQGDKGKGSRVKLWGILETTSRETVCTVAVISWVNIGRIEAQDIGARSIRSRRPVAAAWPLTVNTSASDEAATCHR